MAQENTSPAGKTTTEESYINEVVINLMEDEWFVKLCSLKYNRVKRFIIHGNTMRITNFFVKLHAMSLLNIINEAIRVKCAVFEFNQVDFILLKDAKFPIILPVRHLHFQKCDNVIFFVPHIFSICSNKHNNRIIKGIGREYGRINAKVFEYDQITENDRSNVNTIWFSDCRGDSLELKNRVNINLRNNYQFRTIQYAGPIRASNDASNKSHGELNKSTNKLLRRNAVGRLIFKQSILTLIGLRRFNRGSLINLLPRDIVLIITGMLYKSKGQYCHSLGNNLFDDKEKLKDFDIEDIYRKSKLPTGHQELLNVEYSEYNDKCLDTLRDLCRKRITINKLVMTDVTPAFDDAFDVHNHNILHTIKFHLMHNLFVMLMDTKTKILEIHNMDFDEDTIMLESNDEGETLDGDDAKIWKLNGPDRWDLPFMEIHLVGCRDIWNFLHYFLKLVERVGKYKIGGTTMYKRFSFGGISLASLELNVQRNISIYVDAQKDHIDIKERKI